ncbi:hypothetical protein GQ53DRAFT_472710 [Thozetella sp. PMI_491]|nr:hypothetical protein GQ53DRAFT_472710 [Thozetella sp. PMI_491]
MHTNTKLQLWTWQTGPSLAASKASLPVQRGAGPKLQRLHGTAPRGEQPIVRRSPPQVRPDFCTRKWSKTSCNIFANSACLQPSVFRVFCVPLSPL